MIENCEDQMAESTKEITVKRPKPKAGAGGAAAPKKQTAKPEPVTALPTSAPETAPKPRFGFFRSLGGRKASTTSETTPAPAAKGGAQAATTEPGSARPKRQQSSLGRFFFGMSLYLILALVAEFVLTFIFQHVPGQGQQVLFSLPILGDVTIYLLVWVLALILILYSLYKFNVLPRSLGQPREKIAAVKADPKATRTAPAKVAREPVEGPNDEAYARVKARIRAERRKARRG
jgi:hypothetical protein